METTDPLLIACETLSPLSKLCDSSAQRSSPYAWIIGTEESPSERVNQRLPSWNWCWWKRFLCCTWSRQSSCWLGAIQEL